MKIILCIYVWLEFHRFLSILIFFAVHIKVTQFFYIATFIGTLGSAVGSSMFLLCSLPEEKRTKLITFVLGITLIVSGNSTLLFKMYVFN